MVVQNTVVRHMAIGHNQIVVTHHGLAFRRRTAMDGAALAHHVAVADDRPCDFAFELQILRDGAYHGRRKDMTILADLGIAANGGIGVYTRSVAYLHILVDEHKRTDLYILADLGCRMNTC